METGVEMEEHKVAVEEEEEEVQAQVYPAPLHSHEEVVRDKLAFMESLRRFHSSMSTKFMYAALFSSFPTLTSLYWLFDEASSVVGKDSCDWREGAGLASLVRRSDSKGWPGKGCITCITISSYAVWSIRNRSMIHRWK